MFCSKCGMQNPDDARFCSGCGNVLQNSEPAQPAPAAPAAPVAPAAPAEPTPAAPVYQQQVPYQATYQAPGSVPPPIDTAKKKSKAPIVVISLILVAAIIAAALYFTGIISFGGRTYEQTADELCSIFNDMKITRIIDLIPQEVLDAIMDAEDMDEDDVLDQLEEMEDEMKDGFKLLEEKAGGKITFSFEMTDYEYLDDDDFYDLADEYEEECDLIIDDAMEIEIEMHMESEDDEDDETAPFVLIQVGNDWYVDFISFADVM